MAISFNDWCYYRRGVISRKPPYASIEVDTKALFKHFRKALYIRWDSDFDLADTGDYYHVIKDTTIEIESLASNTRNMIRRCLKNCSIQVVDCEQIINGGGTLSMRQNIEDMIVRGLLHPLRRKITGQ